MIKSQVCCCFWLTVYLSAGKMLLNSKWIKPKTFLMFFAASACVDQKIIESSTHQWTFEKTQREKNSVVFSKNVKKKNISLPRNMPL